MARWTSRIRAAFGIGLTWAAAWFAAGMVLLAIVGLHAADVPFPLFFGLLGFIGGVAFSAILGVVARRRRFDQMSLPGFAGWGALGGALLAGGVNLAAGPSADFLGLAALFAGAGAVSATGTLALARRSERQALPDADDDKLRLG
jgi:hypothetical protein